MLTPTYTFHLLGNAHIDPVWLWDWREGLNEALPTVRTILDLMDEHPDLTFMRGESLIYRHIEQNAPATLERIRAQIKAGRWDVVGGTFIQPDTNLPCTEALIQQFLYGRRYFESRFGQAPRIAWAADSFGHCGGLPEILAQAGMTGFAFTRPDSRYMTLPNPAFWWEGPGGSRVLAYRSTNGWYASERDIRKHLDSFLEQAALSPMRNVGIFYGLGNHGGGPSRRHLDDIGRWAKAHPEVQVIHSTLHRFFRVLEEEDRQHPGGSFPTHRGELHSFARGCYVSLAKFKFPYRRAEAELIRAEATDSILAAQLDRKPTDLTKPWESLLFNAFHDILPGSSIERAYDDQLSWLGAARYDAQRVEFEALNALAAQIDTTVPHRRDDQPSRVPFLVWNPHPHTYIGPVELEASLDYRPIWAYENRVDEVPIELIDPAQEPVVFQVVRNEHSCMPSLPVRSRVVFQAKLPPMGWSIYQIGLGEKKIVPEPSSVRGRVPGTIENDSYRIVARKGADTLQVLDSGKPLFAGKGLSVYRVDDPWGSWGGMNEEKEAIILSSVQERWKITATEVLEAGPERAALWVRFAGKRSRLDLTFFLSRGRKAVDVHARVFWNERSSRLKMAFPVGDHGRFEVPGGVVERGPSGEVPGGRWVSVGQSFGFASDALYGFDLEEGVFRASVVRATRYANDVRTEAHEEPWRPAVDAGELTFRFLFTADVANLPRLASELEKPIVSQMVGPHPGALPREGSLLELEPENVQLVALRHAVSGKGWIIRVQETAGRSTTVRVAWLGKSLSLGSVASLGLAAFHIQKDGAGWKALPASPSD